MKLLNLNDCGIRLRAPTLKLQRQRAKANPEPDSYRVSGEGKKKIKKN